MPILTIDSARLNGTPSAGTVRITASRSPLMDSGSNTVYSGTQTFPLDAQGKLSVSLPATDSPSIGPFTYTVEANLASGQWIYRGVKLPANVATIDITDAQSASQNMYPTRQEWDAITAGMNTAIAGKVDGPGMTLRRDMSVGTRIFLDHPGGSTILYGDSGWRNISGLLTNGATGQLRAHIHTRGSQPWVTLSAIYVSDRLDTTNTTSDLILNLSAAQIVPANYLGTYTTLGTFWTGASGNGTPAPVGVSLDGGERRMVIRTKDILHGGFSYPIAAWPTTLPGTPV